MVHFIKLNAKTDFCSCETISESMEFFVRDFGLGSVWLWSVKCIIICQVYVPESQFHTPKECCISLTCRFSHKRAGANSFQHGIRVERCSVSREEQRKQIASHSQSQDCRANVAILTPSSADRAVVETQEGSAQVKIIYKQLSFKSIANTHQSTIKQLAC